MLLEINLWRLNIYIAHITSSI